jgi:calcineurin-like phosphoesterase
VVHRYRTGLPQRFGICETDVQLQGCIIDIDDATGRARSIYRVIEKLPPA